MDPREIGNAPDKDPTGDEGQAASRYATQPNRSLLLQRQVIERKYFDSGDYAMSKVGDDSVTGHHQTGKHHPAQFRLPQLSSPAPSAGNVSSNAGASQYSPTGTKPERSSSLKKELQSHAEVTKDTGMTEICEKLQPRGQDDVASQVTAEESKPPPD